MTTHLFDNTVGPPGISGGFTGYFELGMAFYVAVDCGLSEVRWYATNTTTTDKPGALSVWNRQTGQLIWTTSTVPHSGSVGWQTTTLSPATQLYAGGEYVVSLTLPTGKSVGAISAISLPPSPLGNLNSGKGVQSAFGASGVMPTSVSANAWWVDVGVDSSNPPVTGGSAVTNDQLNAKLIAWLASTGDNTHTSDGTPWKTYQDAEATKTLAEGATGFDAIKAVADAVAAAVGGLPGTIASAVTTLTGQISSAVVAIAGAGGHTLADIFGDTTTLLSHIADLIAGNAGGTSGALSGRSDFPTVLWTLADERDWTGQLAWAVPADLYVLSITDANGAPPTVVDGVNWYPRLGWWAPLTSTLVGDRRFFEFDACRLEDGGRRMAGILIKANDGLVTGHIQAWVLT